MALELDGVYQITLEGTVLDQTVANIWYCVVQAVGSVDGNETQLAEAWWNHVKVQYRAVAVTNYATAFQNVKVEQCGTGVRGYGVYPIPIAEQSGTRSNGSGGGAESLPSFTAVGMRLNVGSRQTRPGQKRLWGLAEIDQNANTLQASAFNAAVALGTRMEGLLTLGAPLALTQIYHVIRKSGPLDHNLLVNPITTTSVSRMVRSQVSRRPRAF